MNILLITHSNDNDSVTLVSQLLEKQEAKVFRFNTDLYPTQTMMSSEYVDGKRQLTLKTPSFTVNLDTIDAVWYRRLRTGSKIPKDIEKQLYKASIEESKRTFIGMIESIGKFTMDPYHKVRYTENKQLQLELAVSLGIEVPKTLFTKILKT